MNDHKYESRTGFPTFWNHMLDALEFKTDYLQGPDYSSAHEDVHILGKKPVRRCICSNCEAHLGHIYDDGPAPFFKRIQVMSAALNFTPKPPFELSPLSKEKYKELKEKAKES
jgi:peptide-methionine (R)-S-oxide reductase